MNYVVFSLFILPLSFVSVNSSILNSEPVGIIQKQTPIKDLKAFSTDWESPSTWKTKIEGDIVAYYFERETPEITNHSLTSGTVAVFARGIKDDVYNAQNTPLSLPLYLFPVHENVNGILEYKFASMHGKVQMLIQMQKDIENVFLDQKNNIQFRYFFLPDALLKQHKISKEQVKQLSYNRILEILQPAA
jgi:hypothetical protein